MKGRVKFSEFSPKQLKVLTWWAEGSPSQSRDAIICDGAVRSGKTLCMSISFVLWAMRCFDGAQLALCGKTIISLRRNIVNTLLPVLKQLGFSCSDSVSRNCVTVEFMGRSNSFCLFGGRDESSQSLIQGATFAGVLLDEVALMPRSFVEQAAARCSVENSKLWFNCNPEGPEHWFYLEWIKRAEERNALYLHFTMEDNPSLSRRMLARYKRMYSGMFFRRFVLGEWVVADGRIYDFFDERYVRKAPKEESITQFAISCDYGTANPASFGLWGLSRGTWYRLQEFYYDSRREGRQKTDAEYVDDLMRLAGGRRLRAVVVDPSAASFIEALRRKSLPVIKAVNDVVSGIRLTADLLRAGRLVICEDCKDAVREFSLYRWSENGKTGHDAPLKANDHAMDDIRYFASTIVGAEDEGVVAMWVDRPAYF